MCFKICSRLEEISETMQTLFVIFDSAEIRVLGATLDKISLEICLKTLEHFPPSGFDCHHASVFLSTQTQQGGCSLLVGLIDGSFFLIKLKRYAAGRKTLTFFTFYKPEVPHLQVGPLKLVDSFTDDLLLLGDSSLFFYKTFKPYERS